ncbi:LysM domain/BON superfamily protein [Bartonella australis AUST/NH1]|uniref:LysM domain/BON superfamily protein n=1 Tax=Bartonella australis (strain Aust/NH1) TaxID=1094489 RepID=M1NWV4_BARAA|nr:peptidoglycan-binding protein LysM [Bartonella australis]AGF73962.1 LysM domain/BON superfamily protein [Bartonella australis AUST/NH1]
MGLFNFVKTVGKKLGIGDGEPKEKDLKAALDNFQLGTEKVNIQIENGKVVLKGEVKDRETLEKAILIIGNSRGVSSVDVDQLKIASTTLAKDSRFYEVKSGDNLWKIAEEVYGKGQGDKNMSIFEANKPMLKSPDEIYPGQILRIPEID